MKTIKSFLNSLLAKGLREDGRDLFQYRPVEIEVNPISRANGSARVKLGKTEVLVGVKLDVGEPFPDTPDEGILIVNAELSPLASPEFEPGPPGPDAIELARVIDRGIRESGALDVEKMCIKPGEKVWIAFVDIYPINDDGNLFDAAALAAIVALKNAVYPRYDQKEDKVYHKEFTDERLPIRCYPILCTFGKIGDTLFLDPSKREQSVLDSRLSICTIADRTVVAMQKGGIGVFNKSEILKMLDIAFKRGEQLRKQIK